MEFLAPTAGLIGGIAFLIVSLRFAKSMRRESDEDWRRRWRALEPKRRKEIARTIRRGEPILERDDAELALRAIAQIELVRRGLRPVELVAILVLVCCLAFGVILHLRLLVIGTVVALVVFGLTGALSEWQRKRLLKSADATRKVLRADRP